MSKWIRVALLDDCPPGAACELVAENRIIALYNIDGTFHALDGICPHQGGPLGKGALAGCVVTCPWHGWQFDVTTGQHQTNASLRHAQFSVRVDDGAVWVDLER
jgi:nitrite reductase/ring-hydroxylating ferredoxin subunit